MNPPWPAVLALAALAALAATASAQPPSPRPPEPVTITLHPADEPIPALRYRLAPERRDLVPGNAAIFYHRAIQIVLQKRSQSTPGAPEPTNVPESQIQEWTTGPIETIDVARARDSLQAFAAALREVELGAARLTCDWEYDQRSEGITLLIGEIQEARTLARLVALQARLAILDGDTDAALHWIQVGFTLGRHTADGPTVIQALVGVAIDTLMTGCLQDLIQRPGTPSLYWALVDRPRPMIDMRRPLEGERYLLEKELPDLSQLDRGVWSKDEARRFADELQRKLPLWTGSSVQDQAAASDLSSLGRRLGIAAMAAKIYPEAKKRLIAHGRPAEVVERMPVIQVAALDTILEYSRARDDLYKWMRLPYWQAHTGIDKGSYMGMDTPERKLDNPLLALFTLLTPSLKATILAQVRLERQLDALQTIEAIRMAAKRDGVFPASLDDLPVPAPLDPATGQPFHYKADGHTATLFAPPPPGGPDHPFYILNITLRLTN